MLNEGRVGPITAQDGAINVLRQDKTGALVIAGGHGYYNELVSRGLGMIVSTGVAGVAPGTALSTTPPMAVWNPPGSGKNLAILVTTVGYVSGTLGAGSIVYAVVPSQTTTPSGGTELTPQNALLGTPRGVGRAFQGSTLASTPTIVKATYILGAALATSVAFPTIAKDFVDAEIIVPPGAVFVMQGVAAAGSTPLVSLSVTWEEVQKT